MPFGFSQVLLFSASKSERGVQGSTVSECYCEKSENWQRGVSVNLIYSDLATARPMGIKG